MSYTFPAVTESLGAILSAAERFASESGCSRTQQMNILLAVEELSANIISYAYDDEAGEIEIGLNKLDNGIRIRLGDSGRPFNPIEAEDPDTSLSLDERTPGGLGIYLVKKLALSLEYERVGDKNIITAVFPCGG